MENYRNTAAALVLALVLSTSAFAGDGIIYTDKTPPPPASQTETVAADGIIYTDEAEPAPGAAGTAAEIALDLLRSVLTLL